LVEAELKTAANHSYPLRLRFWHKVDHYIKTARGMQHYLRLPREQDWKARIERNLANRGEVWNDTLRRTVFRYAANPYRRMFELESEDIFRPKSGIDSQHLLTDAQ
jgi:hypothetical protein